jgi:hypothetical protein
MEICKNKYSILGRKREEKRKFELPKVSDPGQLI